MPAAALLIHDRTSVPLILALDNDENAVGLASKVVSRFGTGRVAAVRADGLEFDYAGADAILREGLADRRFHSRHVLLAVVNGK